MAEPYIQFALSIDFDDHENAIHLVSKIIPAIFSRIGGNPLFIEKYSNCFKSCIMVSPEIVVDKIINFSFKIMHVHGHDSHFYTPLKFVMDMIKQLALSPITNDMLESKLVGVYGDHFYRNIIVRIVQKLTELLEAKRALPEAEYIEWSESVCPNYQTIGLHIAEASDILADPMIFVNFVNACIDNIHIKFNQRLILTATVHMLHILKLRGGNPNIILQYLTIAIIDRIDDAYNDGHIELYVIVNFENIIEKYIGYHIPFIELKDMPLQHL
jgi:hypothetical protein